MSRKLLVSGRKQSPGSFLFGRHPPPFLIAAVPLLCSCPTTACQFLSSSVLQNPALIHKKKTSSAKEVRRRMVGIFRLLKLNAFPPSHYRGSSFCRAGRNRLFLDVSHSRWKLRCALDGSGLIWNDLEGVFVGGRHSPDSDKYLTKDAGALEARSRPGRCGPTPCRPAGGCLYPISWQYRQGTPRLRCPSAFRGWGRVVLRSGPGGYRPGPSGRRTAPAWRCGPSAS